MYTLNTFISIIYIYHIHKYIYVCTCINIYFYEKCHFTQQVGYFPPLRPRPAFGTANPTWGDIFNAVSKLKAQVSQSSSLSRVSRALIFLELKAQVSRAWARETWEQSSREKSKARETLFTETWQKTRSSFELWASENVIPRIGCTYLWKSFICATRLIQMCDMTHSYVWRDSFICATWLIHSCDMTH